MFGKPVFGKRVFGKRAFARSSTPSSASARSARVRTATATVGLLAAGPALTGCGPVKMGAAATFGHDRITIASLDADVAEWARELPQYPGARQILQEHPQQVPIDPGSPRRSALFQLVMIHLWDEAAREDGLAVGESELDAFIDRNGGPDNFKANVLAEGLPTKYARDYARRIFINVTLRQRYGAAAGGQSQDPLSGLLSRAGRTLNIKISPRYGSFDYQKNVFGRICPELSTPDSGTSAGPVGEVKCL